MHLFSCCLPERVDQTFALYRYQFAVHADFVAAITFFSETLQLFAVVVLCLNKTEKRTSFIKEIVRIQMTFGCGVHSAHPWNFL